MRRKLVFLTVALIAAVFCFSRLKLDMRPLGAEKLLNSNELYGRIVSADVKEDYTNLTIFDIKSKTKCLVIISSAIENPEFYIGSIIKAEAELSIPDTRRNPYCFDYRMYLYSENIFATGEIINCIQIIKNDLYSKFLKWIYTTKTDFGNILSESSHGIVMGVLFGDKDYLEEDVFNGFRDAGTAHILTVSGLHINLIYELIRKIFGKRQSAGNILIIVLLLLIYGTFSSWRPSIIRAEGMILLKIIAEYKELRYDSLTSMSFMALCLILNNPYIVYSQAFQMSFLAIASINILTRAIPDVIPEALLSSLAVCITLSVYQAFVFNRISLVSLFANIPVLYLAGILIPFTFIVFSIYVFCGTILFFSLPLDSLVYVTEKANQIVSLNGKGCFDVISLKSGFVILILLCIFYECSEHSQIQKVRNYKFKLLKTRIIIVLISLASFVLFYDPVSYCQLVFVDVGQGDCIHIKDRTTNILIDGGGSFSKNIGEDTLKPYLLKNGVSSLDFVIATHEDMDHYKGLEELSNCFNTPEIIKGSTAGDIFKISKNIKISTLWPIEIDENGQNENSECSVFLIDYNGVRIMTTGDLDQDGEHRMLEYYNKIGKSYLLKATILKVGHHGSKSSTSQEFIDAVEPEYAIIQVGRNNYGHPSPQIIELLEKNNIQIYRNDTMGAIGVKIKKNKGYYSVNKIVYEIN